MKPKAGRGRGSGVVVFGKDGAAKPHASWFGEADARLALKAARLMGMQALRPISEAARELTAKLPKGRVFASGRGFVPFVRPKLYEALATAQADPLNQIPLSDMPEEKHLSSDAAAAGQTDTTSPSTEPREGSVVLAPAAPGEGWWEAVIVKVKGDLLTLRWRDYPDDPVFARRRHQIALFDFANAPSAK